MLTRASETSWLPILLTSSMSALLASHLSGGSPAPLCPSRGLRPRPASPGPEPQAGPPSGRGRAVEGPILLSRPPPVRPRSAPCPLRLGGCCRLLRCPQPCRPRRGPRPAGEQDASFWGSGLPGTGLPGLLCSPPARASAAARAGRPCSSAAAPCGAGCSCRGAGCRQRKTSRPPAPLPALPAALSWPWQPPPLDSLASALGPSLC